MVLTSLPSCAVVAKSNPYCEYRLLLQNVKAYLRRGFAREVTLNYKEALQGVAFFFVIALNCSS
jgi:hypothetical protein